MKRITLIAAFSCVANTIEAGLLALAGVLLVSEAVHAEVQWYKLFERYYQEDYVPFRDSSIPAMAEFQGQIYIGTGRHQSGNIIAHVYRLVGEECRIWEDVSPPWEPAYTYNVTPFWWSTLTGGRSMAMQVFKNQLYLGTDQGEVLRTKDGFNWENVTGKWIDDENWIDEVWAMAEFNGYLYVAFGGVEIWRTDGSAWQPVVGPFPALHGLGFGKSGKRDLRSLEVFKGHLYAGVGKDGWNGIQLWRTQDGIHWKKYKEMSQDLPNNILFPPGHVHALTSFKGYLHVGESEGDGLYRTDGSVDANGTATVWDYHANVAEGTGIFRFAEQAGTLFLGTYNLGFRPCEKCPLVYSSLDGKNWKVVPNSPINNDNHQSVSSLLVSSVMQNSPGSKLYVGTKNDNDSGWLILYQYGPSPGNCIAHAVKTAVHDLSSRIGNIQQVLERCAVLPCLYERPPLIRPIPPVDDLFPEDAFETPLVNEIMEAVEYEMQASPDDDDLKDQVVEHLAMVRGKLIQALYPFHNNFTGDDVFNQTVDWSVVDEAIVGLDVAQEHCHKASILLSHMSGGKGPRKSR